MTYADFVALISFQELLISSQATALLSTPLVALSGLLLVKLSSGSPATVLGTRRALLFSVILVGKGDAGGVIGNMGELTELGVNGDLHEHPRMN